MLRIGSIVLRVDDLRRQTEFWEAALGYVRRDDGESDDFVLLGPPDGVGPNVALDRVHYVVCRSLRASTSTCTPRTKPGGRALARDSARPRSTGTSDPADADYVILADPEGNRFCVVDVTR